MTQLSSWKMPVHSNSASTCYIYSSNSNKITPFSRPKSSRNGNFHQPRTSLLVMLKNPCSKNSKKPDLWKNLRLGSKKLKGILLLNLITVVYASEIGVIKDVEAFTDPAYFSAVRFGFSVIPFLPFMFQAREESHIRKCGLELGVWVSLGYLSQALGLVTSDAGRASFISMFTVILIPVMESVLGESVPARTWFGIVMSVVGILMLECSGSPPNIGDLFNFLSAIFFGIHTLRTEHISRTTTKEHLLPLLGYEVCVVAILSIIWCVVEGKIEETMSWSWGWFWDQMVVFPWVPALYTGLFSTGFCLWGEIAAMQDVSATETAVIYGLEPVWGAGFAWFLLGERWGIAGWIGALLILGGSLTVPMLGGSENEAMEKKDKKKHSASPLMVRSSNRDMLKK